MLGAVAEGVLSVADRKGPWFSGHVIKAKPPLAVFVCPPVSRVVFSPHPVPASNRNQKLKRVQASLHFRALDLRRPGPALSMTLCASSGRRRILDPPAPFHHPAIPPPTALLRLLGTWPVDHAGLWRAQGCFSSIGAARNIPDLARNRRRLGPHPSPSELPTARELSESWFEELLF